MSSTYQFTWVRMCLVYPILNFCQCFLQFLLSVRIQFFYIEKSQRIRTVKKASDTYHDEDLFENDDTDADKVTSLMSRTSVTLGANGLYVLGYDTTAEMVVTFR
jgi:hypothetical protein